MYPAADGHAIDHRSDVFFLRGVVADGLIAKPWGTGVICHERGGPETRERRFLPLPIASSEPQRLAFADSKPWR
jgi:hypothetical protein